jgi:hypothetical protein
MNDIFWIKGNPPAPLAIVLRPRGDEWLEDELLGMRRGGIQTLVSLLEEDEAVLLGLADEAPIAEHVGLKFLSYPIPDTEIPSNIAAFQTFVAGLANRPPFKRHEAAWFPIRRSRRTGFCATRPDRDRSPQRRIPTSPAPAKPSPSNEAGGLDGFGRSFRIVLLWSARPAH